MVPIKTTGLSAADKPVAWQILQVVTLLAVPALLIGGAYLTRYAQTITPRGDGTIGGLVLAVFFVLSTWSLAIVVTAYRRMPAVRWLGGSFILTLILLSLVVLSFVANARETDSTLRAALIAGASLLTVGECCWLYAFAFSQKARRYLGRA